MSDHRLISDYLPAKTKIVKNQVALLEKASKTYGNIPKIFGAHKNPIGIEVEVERAPSLIPNSLYWETVPDGSLKNMGAEFVSCPIAGHNIDYALHELRTTLHNAPVDWSHRTSIHVHVGTKGMSVLQLKALIMAYACLERLFFSFTEEHRRGNPYCYYLVDTDPIDIRIGDDQMKYCAFNVGNSISNFNTVEFRHMHGTGDFKLIRRWLLLIIKLTEYVRTNPAHVVIKQVCSLNTTSEYQVFCKDIFNTSFKFLMEFDFQKEMEEGVLWAKVYNIHNIEEAE